MGRLSGERNVRELMNSAVPQKSIDYPLHGKNEPPRRGGRVPAQSAGAGTQ